MELFERPKQGESAILVQIQFNNLNRNSNRAPKTAAPLTQHQSDTDFDQNEFVELVGSAGANPLLTITGSRYSPDPKFFVGSGKADEIKLHVDSLDADIVIFDHTLSPAQERNLEKRFQCRVLDRTGLILDIFAQRAQSHEGKLQVELAQLKHLSSRLVRGWTHLERQKGGIGLRGPGETQLETDRRLLSIRIKQINKRLEKVRNQREQGRQSRKKAEIPTVSLVGYTNAGKSTLFNTLTTADVYAADQLFATLDPTLRRLELPDQQSIILADTVGFVRDLPHDLVAAFRSTLQETIEADLLLHVMDSQQDQRDDLRFEVNNVIREIGADKVTQVEIFNKIDNADPSVSPRLEEAHDGIPTRVWLSAKTGEGIGLLTDYLARHFATEVFRGDITVSPRYSRLRAQLYNDKAILEESTSTDGDFILSISIQKRKLDQLLEQNNLTLDTLNPVPS